MLSLLDTGKLVGTRGSYELTAAIESLEVPATVKSLLAARIDRLGEREKQVLYTAAVIGKEFARPLLESVIDLSPDDLDAALAALLNAEMINERSLYPVAEYAFKHPLTHEVALQPSSAARGVSVMLRLRWRSRRPNQATWTSAQGCSRITGRRRAIPCGPRAGMCGRRAGCASTTWPRRAGTGRGPGATRATPSTLRSGRGCCSGCIPS